MTYAIIITVVLAVVLLSRSKKKSSAPRPASGWRNLYGKGLPDYFQPQGNGFVVDLPADPKVELHYVQGPALTGPTLTMRGTITGGPLVPCQFTDREPRMYLMLRRRGDGATAESLGIYEGFRWFSLVYVPMVPGPFELVVPLTLDHWKSIKGVNNPAEFAAMLNDLEAVYVVCGSDGGRGHGVYAAQAARLYVEVR